MKWDIKKSMKVKTAILEHPELMAKITKRVEAVFKEFKVLMPGMSYVFEPRVFSMDTAEVPEISIKSRAAMLSAILDDLAARRAGSAMQASVDAFQYTACLPQCGPLDPISLRILERIRIPDLIADDPVPIKTSDQLMRRIISNGKLMEKLSEAFFGILSEMDIVFSSKEGCVFTPVVFQAPVYAQKVGSVAAISEIEGFGPQLYAYADPTPEPSAVRIKPFPGIIEIHKGRTLVPGVIIDRRWWIGIPAPELLRALDIMRQYR